MFYSDISDKIDNFIFVVLLLNIPVPEFDLGMSFGKVKSGKDLWKVWKFLFKIA